MRTCNTITNAFWINCINFKGPKSLIMPLSIAVICGMGILLYTTVSGQNQPNSNKQTKFISQPVQEQKSWQERQLPGNSVVDQMAYRAPANDMFSRTRPKYFREQ